MSRPDEPAPDESSRVVQRYARRADTARDTASAGAALPRYSPLRPEVWQTLQERQRAQLRLFKALGWHNLGDKRVLEVGCGAGGNLLELLRLGCAPEHLQGIDLLSERVAMARALLPASLRLHEGDASQLDLPDGSLDVVLQSTVFSSLLDTAFRQQLAQAMWRWLAPGGGVLWYDFTVDNPFNRDVRGVPLNEIRALFPQGRTVHRRITLAPPLARAVCAVHPTLYSAFNLLPPLRTHVLAWIEKP